MNRSLITIMKYTTHLKDGCRELIFLFQEKKCSLTFGLEI